MHLLQYNLTSNVGYDNYADLKQIIYSVIRKYRKALM